MTYHESLWRNAPIGATHWGTGKQSSWTRSGFFGFPEDGKEDMLRFWLEEHQAWSSWFTPLSQLNVTPKPQAYQSPAQLVEAYRKEHGTEIEADVDDFLSFDPHTVLEDSLGNAVYHTIIIEKYLTAERARIEGEA